MIEFGFNKLDTITVTVFQGSDETTSQPGWYLNGGKMLLYPHRHWRGQESLQPARIRRLKSAVEPVLPGQWRGWRKQRMQVSRCPRRWRSGSCWCDAASPWCSWSSSSPLQSPSPSCSTPRKRNPPPHRGTTMRWSWCLCCFYSLSGGSFPPWRSKVVTEAEPLLLPPPNTRGQRKTLQLYTCCFN